MKQRKFLYSALIFIVMVVCTFVMLLLTPSETRADAKLQRREAIMDSTYRNIAKKFGLPHQIVQAIVRQESYCNPLCINIAGKDYYPKDVPTALALCEYAEQSGKQYDVGLMQINRYWIRKYRIPHKLLLNPVDNVYVGCYILSRLVKRHGMSWEAIGRYHSSTPWRKVNYSQKIQRHLASILEK